MRRYYHDTFNSLDSTNEEDEISHEDVLCTPNNSPLGSISSNQPFHQSTFNLTPQSTQNDQLSQCNPFYVPDDVELYRPNASHQPLIDQSNNLLTQWPHNLSDNFHENFLRDDNSQSHHSERRQQLPDNQGNHYHRGLNSIGDNHSCTDVNNDDHHLSSSTLTLGTPLKHSSWSQIFPVTRSMGDEEHSHEIICDDDNNYSRMCSGIHNDNNIDNDIHDELSSKLIPATIPNTIPIERCVDTQTREIDQRIEDAHLFVRAWNDDEQQYKREELALDRIHFQQNESDQDPLNFLPNTTTTYQFCNGGINESHHETRTYYHNSQMSRGSSYNFSQDRYNLQQEQQLHSQQEHHDQQEQHQHEEKYYVSPLAQSLGDSSSFGLKRYAHRFIMAESSSVSNNDDQNGEMNEIKSNTQTTGDDVPILGLNCRFTCAQISTTTSSSSSPTPGSSSSSSRPLHIISLAQNPPLQSNFLHGYQLPPPTVEPTEYFNEVYVVGQNQGNFPSRQQEHFGSEHSPSRLLHSQFGPLSPHTSPFSSPSVILVDELSSPQQQSSHLVHSIHNSERTIESFDHANDTPIPHHSSHHLFRGDICSQNTFSQPNPFLSTPIYMENDQSSQYIVEKNHDTPTTSHLAPGEMTQDQDINGEISTQCPQVSSLPHFPCQQDGLTVLKDQQQPLGITPISILASSSRVHVSQDQIIQPIKSIPFDSIFASGRAILNENKASMTTQGHHVDHSRHRREDHSYTTLNNVWDTLNPVPQERLQCDNKTQGSLEPTHHQSKNTNSVIDDIFVSASTLKKEIKPKESTPSAPVTNKTEPNEGLVQKRQPKSDLSSIFSSASALVVDNDLVTKQYKVDLPCGSPTSFLAKESKIDIHLPANNHQNDIDSIFVKATHIPQENGAVLPSDIFSKASDIAHQNEKPFQSSTTTPRIATVSTTKSSNQKSSAFQPLTPLAPSVPRYPNGQSSIQQQQQGQRKKPMPGNLLAGPTGGEKLRKWVEPWQKDKDGNIIVSPAARRNRAKQLADNQLLLSGYFDGSNPDAKRKQIGMRLIEKNKILDTDWFPVEIKFAHLRMSYPTITNSTFPIIASPTTLCRLIIDLGGTITLRTGDIDRVTSQGSITKSSTTSTHQPILRLLKMVVNPPQSEQAPLSQLYSEFDAVLPYNYPSTPTNQKHQLHSTLKKSQEQLLFRKILSYNDLTAFPLILASVQSYQYRPKQHYDSTIRDPDSSQFYPHLVNHQLYPHSTVDEPFALHLAQILGIIEQSNQTKWMKRRKELVDGDTNSLGGKKNSLFLLKRFAPTTNLAQKLVDKIKQKKDEIPLLNPYETNTNGNLMKPQQSNAIQPAPIQTPPSLFNPCAKTYDHSLLECWWGGDYLTLVELTGITPVYIPTEQFQSCYQHAGACHGHNTFSAHNFDPTSPTSLRNELLEQHGSLRTNMGANHLGTPTLAGYIKRNSAQYNPRSGIDLTKRGTDRTTIIPPTESTPGLNQGKARTAAPHSNGLARKSDSFSFWRHSTEIQMWQDTPTSFTQSQLEPNPINIASKSNSASNISLNRMNKDKSISLLDHDDDEEELLDLSFDITAFQPNPTHSLSPFPSSPNQPSQQEILPQSLLPHALPPTMESLDTISLADLLAAGGLDEPIPFTYFHWFENLVDNLHVQTSLNPTHCQLECHSFHHHIHRYAIHIVQTLYLVLQSRLNHSHITTTASPSPIDSPLLPPISLHSPSIIHQLFSHLTAPPQGHSMTPSFQFQFTMSTYQLPPPFLPLQTTPLLLTPIITFPPQSCLISQHNVLVPSGLAGNSVSAQNLPITEREPTTSQLLCLTLFPHLSSLPLQLILSTYHTTTLTPSSLKVFPATPLDPINANLQHPPKLNDLITYITASQTSQFHNPLLFVEPYTVTSQDPLMISPLRLPHHPKLIGVTYLSPSHFIPLLMFILKSTLQTQNYHFVCSHLRLVLNDISSEILYGKTPPSQFTFPVILNRFLSRYNRECVNLERSPFDLLLQQDLSNVFQHNIRVLSISPPTALFAQSVLPVLRGGFAEWCDKGLNISIAKLPRCSFRNIVLAHQSSIQYQLDSALNIIFDSFQTASTGQPIHLANNMNVREENCDVRKASFDDHHDNLEYTRDDHDTTTFILNYLSHVVPLLETFPISHTSCIPSFIMVLLHLHSQVKIQISSFYAIYHILYVYRLNALHHIGTMSQPTTLPLFDSDSIKPSNFHPTGHNQPKSSSLTPTTANIHDLPQLNSAFPSMLDSLPKSTIGFSRKPITSSLTPLIETGFSFGGMNVAKLDANELTHGAIIAPIQPYLFQSTDGHLALPLLTDFLLRLQWVRTWLCYTSGMAYRLTRMILLLDEFFVFLQIHHNTEWELCVRSIDPNITKDSYWTDIFDRTRIFDEFTLQGRMYFKTTSKAEQFNRQRLVHSLYRQISVTTHNRDSEIIPILPNTAGFGVDQYEQKLSFPVLRSKTCPPSPPSTPATPPLPINTPTSSLFPGSVLRLSALGECNFSQIDFNQHVNENNEIKNTFNSIIDPSTAPMFQSKVAIQQVLLNDIAFKSSQLTTTSQQRQQQQQQQPHPPPPIPPPIPPPSVPISTPQALLSPPGSVAPRLPLQQGHLHEKQSQFTITVGKVGRFREGISPSDNSFLHFADFYPQGYMALCYAQYRSFLHDSVDPANSTQSKQLGTNWIEYQQTPTCCANSAISSRIAKLISDLVHFSEESKPFIPNRSTSICHIANSLSLESLFTLLIPRLIHYVTTTMLSSPVASWGALLESTPFEFVKHNEEFVKHQANQLMASSLNPPIIQPTLFSYIPPKIININNTIEQNGRSNYDVGGYSACDNSSKPRATSETNQATGPTKFNESKEEHHSISTFLHEPPHTKLVGSGIVLPDEIYAQFFQGEMFTQFNLLFQQALSNAHFVIQTTHQLSQQISSNVTTQRHSAEMGSLASQKMHSYNSACFQINKESSDVNLPPIFTKPLLSTKPTSTSPQNYVNLGNSSLQWLYHQILTGHKVLLTQKDIIRKRNANIIPSLQLALKSKTDTTSVKLNPPHYHQQPQPRRFGGLPDLEFWLNINRLGRTSTDQNYPPPPASIITPIQYFIQTVRFILQHKFQPTPNIMADGVLDINMNVAKSTLQCNADLFQNNFNNMKQLTSLFSFYIASIDPCQYTMDNTKLCHSCWGLNQQTVPGQLFVPFSLAFTNLQRKTDIARQLQNQGFNYSYHRLNEYRTKVKQETTNIGLQRQILPLVEIDSKSPSELTPALCSMIFDFTAHLPFSFGDDSEDEEESEGSIQPPITHVVPFVNFPIPVYNTITHSFYIQYNNTSPYSTYPFLSVPPETYRLKALNTLLQSTLPQLPARVITLPYRLGFSFLYSQLQKGVLSQENMSDSIYVRPANFIHPLGGSIARIKLMVLALTPSNSQLFLNHTDQILTCRAYERIVDWVASQPPSIAPDGTINEGPFEGNMKEIKMAMMVNLPPEFPGIDDILRTLECSSNTANSSICDGVIRIDDDDDHGDQDISDNGRSNSTPLTAPTLETIVAFLTTFISLSYRPIVIPVILPSDESVVVRIGDVLDLIDVLPFGLGTPQTVAVPLMNQFTSSYFPALPQLPLALHQDFQAISECIHKPGPTNPDPTQRFSQIHQHLLRFLPTRFQSSLLISSELATFRFSGQVREMISMKQFQDDRNNSQEIVTPIRTTNSIDNFSNLTTDLRPSTALLTTSFPNTSPSLQRLAFYRNFYQKAVHLCPTPIVLPWLPLTPSLFPLDSFSSLSPSQSQSPQPRSDCLSHISSQIAISTIQSMILGHHNPSRYSHPELHHSHLTTQESPPYTLLPQQSVGTTTSAPSQGSTLQLAPYGILIKPLTMVNVLGNLYVPKYHINQNGFPIKKFKPIPHATDNHHAAKSNPKSSTQHFSFNTLAPLHRVIYPYLPKLFTLLEQAQETFYPISHFLSTPTWLYHYPLCPSPHTLTTRNIGPYLTPNYSALLPFIPATHLNQVLTPILPPLSFTSTPGIATHHITPLSAHRSDHDTLAPLDTLKLSMLYTYSNPRLRLAPGSIFSTLGFIISSVTIELSQLEKAQNQLPQQPSQASINNNNNSIQLITLSDGSGEFLHLSIPLSPAKFFLTFDIKSLRPFSQHPDVLKLLTPPPPSLPIRQDFDPITDSMTEENIVSTKTMKDFQNSAPMMKISDKKVRVPAFVHMDKTKACNKTMTNNSNQMVTIPTNNDNIQNNRNDVRSQYQGDLITTEKIPNTVLTPHADTFIGLDRMDNIYKNNGGAMNHNTGPPHRVELTTPKKSILKFHHTETSSTSPASSTLPPHQDQTPPKDSRKPSTVHMNNPIPYSLNPLQFPPLDQTQLIHLVSQSKKLAHISLHNILYSHSIENHHFCTVVPHTRFNHHNPVQIQPAARTTKLWLSPSIVQDLFHIVHQPYHPFPVPSIFYDPLSSPDSNNYKITLTQPSFNLPLSHLPQFSLGLGGINHSFSHNTLDHMGKISEKNASPISPASITFPNHPLVLSSQLHSLLQAHASLTNDITLKHYLYRSTEQLFQIMDEFFAQSIPIINYSLIRNEKAHDTLNKLLQTMIEAVSTEQRAYSRYGGGSNHNNALNTGKHPHISLKPAPVLLRSLFQQYQRYPIEYPRNILPQFLFGTDVNFAHKFKPVAHLPQTYPTHQEASNLAGPVNRMNERKASLPSMIAHSNLGTTYFHPHIPYNPLLYLTNRTNYIDFLPMIITPTISPALLTTFPIPSPPPTAQPTPLPFYHIYPNQVITIPLVSSRSMYCSHYTIHLNPNVSPLLHSSQPLSHLDHFATLSTSFHHFNSRLDGHQIDLNVCIEASPTDSPTEGTYLSSQGLWNVAATLPFETTLTSLNQSQSPQRTSANKIQDTLGTISKFNSNERKSLLGGGNVEYLSDFISLLQNAIKNRFVSSNLHTIRTQQKKHSAHGDLMSKSPITSNQTSPPVGLYDPPLCPPTASILYPNKTSTVTIFKLFNLFRSIINFGEISIHPSSKINASQEGFKDDISILDLLVLHLLTGFDSPNLMHDSELPAHQNHIQTGSLRTSFNDDNNDGNAATITTIDGTNTGFDPSFVTSFLMSLISSDCDEQCARNDDKGGEGCKNSRSNTYITTIPADNCTHNEPHNTSTLLSDFESNQVHLPEDLSHLSHQVAEIDLFSWANDNCITSHDLQHHCKDDINILRENWFKSTKVTLPLTISPFDRDNNDGDRILDNGSHRIMAKEQINQQIPQFSTKKQRRGPRAFPLATSSSLHSLVRPLSLSQHQMISGGDAPKGKTYDDDDDDDIEISLDNCCVEPRCQQAQLTMPSSVLIPRETVLINTPKRSIDCVISDDDNGANLPNSSLNRTFTMKNHPISSSLSIHSDFMKRSHVDNEEIDGERQSFNKMLMTHLKASHNLQLTEYQIKVYSSLAQMARANALVVFRFMILRGKTTSKLATLDPLSSLSSSSATSQQHLSSHINHEQPVNIFVLLCTRLLVTILRLITPRIDYYRFKEHSLTQSNNSTGNPRNTTNTSNNNRKINPLLTSTSRVGLTARHLTYCLLITPQQWVDLSFILRDLMTHRM